MNTQHVIPRDDLLEHDNDSDEGCPCGPLVRFVDGGKVIRHHSLDGREKDESKEE